MIRFLLTPAVVGGFLAASAAQAITLNFTVDVTKAVGGSPVGAVVGTDIGAGSGNTGTTTLTGVGDESISFHPSASGPGAFLSLQIGTMTFDENDDVEGVAFNDVPSAEFSNGTFLGLDYGVLFEIVAGNPVSKQFVSTDIGQDTSALFNTPHYVMEFDGGDGGSGFFSIALLTGFTVVFDPDEGPSGANVLEPIFGMGTVVEGVIKIPEPSLPILLLAVGGVFAARWRRAGIIG